ncbi:hypothetical protein D1821_19060 (plasmid) [Phaeobacter inhibens]|uniref:hypothetical protein n=1 Tax=Phaeobacter TaxID=302485 RepID=UPI000E48E9D9|nr:hypothetical protein [Phaeobacter inhibens]AXT44585.1 hypothetical protein D1821_19060 [Phaeobacter inhibens]
MIAVVALIASVPLLLVLNRFILSRQYLAAFLFGALHGAILAIGSAWWVWTFRDLPPSIPFFAAFVASFWFACLFTGAAILGNLVERAAPVTVRNLLKFSILAMFLTGFEVLRSTSPDFFMPLGTLALAGAAPFLLPLSAVGGMPLLGLFVWLCNSLAAVMFLKAASDKTVVAGATGLLGALLVSHMISETPKPEDQRQTISDELGTVCAYQDTARRDREDGDYLSQEALALWVQRAADTNRCDVLIFPEVSTVVARSERTTLSASQWPIDVLAGVRTVDRIEDQAAFVHTYSTNSLCRLQPGPNGLVCLDRIDKRFLAPFIETQLFHRVGALQGLGLFLTRLMTGDGNTDTTKTNSTTMDLSSGASVGVLVCLEVFMQMQKPRDSKGRPLDVSLIVVPTDHSYFPPLGSMRALMRQAASAQAAVTGTPVLVVSTEEIALVASNGSILMPSAVEGELYIWEIGA